jgi:hypothetical protein
VSAEKQRVERLIALAERLTQALEADIVALKAGRPDQMRTIDPEIQRLSALYSREATGVDAKLAKATPRDLWTRFLAVTQAFRETLAAHGRYLMRVRNASEGMIKAIAEEVERKRALTRTYAPPKAAPQRSSGAMLINVQA